MHDASTKTPHQSYDTMDKNIPPAAETDLVGRIITWLLVGVFLVFVVIIARLIGGH